MTALARLPGVAPARWAWSQLTSMRTALLLLLLLTVAAVPGSLVPQLDVDPVRVAQFRQQHPGLGRWYDRLSLFDVYSAPWFAAIYLLLLLSLAGCVIPRSRAHWASRRAGPPPPPRILSRHGSQTLAADVPAHEALESAAHVLRAAGYRVNRHPQGVSAEKGHLHETGNLVFHSSLLLLLAAVAIGNVWGYQGSVLVPEGGSFSNTVTAYDTFKRGAAFTENALSPFTVTLDDLHVRYQPDGDQRGAPRDFVASLRYRAAPDAEPARYRLRVNHPLVIGGAKVFLIGNGYAPEFIVRDATGEVVFSGPVPFLPRDGNNTSTGVVKVAGAQPAQLGFEGLFLPSAAIHETRGPISLFPDLALPRAVLTAWQGDLGLDDGTPQSVYRLDKTRMTQITKDGRPLAQSLAPGATMTLPGNAGSITFDGVRRWATVQVSRDPGRTPALLASVLALVGLMLSLFVRRRRVWVSAARGDDGRTLVEVAGPSRTEGDDVAQDVAQLTDQLRSRLRRRAAVGAGEED